MDYFWAGTSCSCRPTLKDGNIPPVSTGTRPGALKHALSRDELIFFYRFSHFLLFFCVFLIAKAVGAKFRIVDVSHSDNCIPSEHLTAK